MLSLKQMPSSIYNCVKRYESELIGEKALLISLSANLPIDDFYEVDGHIVYRGLTNDYVADCEKYLTLIDKHDNNSILEASLYLFNLVRRGVDGKIGENALKLLSDLIEKSSKTLYGTKNS